MGATFLLNGKRFPKRLETKVIPQFFQFLHVFVFLLILCGALNSLECSEKTTKAKKDSNSSLLSRYGTFYVGRGNRVWVNGKIFLKTNLYLFVLSGLCGLHEKEFPGFKDFFSWLLICWYLYLPPHIYLDMNLYESSTSNKWSTERIFGDARILRGLWSNQSLVLFESCGGRSGNGFLTNNNSGLSL